MNFNPQKHHRRSIRLKGYDYALPGAYFVTICTYQRQCWFGEILDGRMYLNQIGNVVAQEWVGSSQIRPGMKLDQWVIMPNHLHGLVILTDIVGAHSCAPLHKSPSNPVPLHRQPRSLSSSSLSSNLLSPNASISSAKHQAFLSGNAITMNASSETKNPYRPFDNTLSTIHNAGLMTQKILNITPKISNY
jgi:REP element-mobilizing transposase RayT